MPKKYTPTGDTFPSYPVEIVSNGDVFSTEEFFNNKYIDIYERIEYLKKQQDNSNTNIEDLRENLNTNVGGQVCEESSPVYDGTKIIQNGDSHHKALEKLDAAITDNSDNIIVNRNNIGSNSAKISSIGYKLGDNASDPGGWNYNSNNFIQDGTNVKTILELFDKIHLGTRKIGEFNWENTIKNQAEILKLKGYNIILYGYDTFYNDSKYNIALTTADIDFYQRQASKENSYIVWEATSPGDIRSIMFETFSEGALEIRFSTQGISDWDSMESYTVGEGAFQNCVNIGTNLVIKIKLLSDAKLFVLKYFCNADTV